MYTTDDLVASVKLRASLPSSQALFSNDDLIDFCDMELKALIVPMIMDTREEFLVVQREVTQSTAAIVIPQNAIGLKLKMLELVRFDGSTYPLSRIDYPQRGGYSATNSPGQPIYFYYLGNNAFVYPDPVTSFSFRITYFRRPNKLTAVLNCARVDSVDALTNTLSCSTVPPAWTTGTRIDVIKGQPGFDAVVEDAAIVNISGTDVTIASVAGIEPGDYLAPTGFSPIPQVVYEAHNLVAQAAAVKTMESLSDQKGLENAQAKLEEAKRAFLTSITPRAESAAKKVVQMNGPLRPNFARNWWL